MHPRHRVLSTGLVYAGAGVGGAVFALIAAALIKAYNIPWAFRIIGIIFTAINLPSAYMLKSRHAKVPLRKREGEVRAKVVDWWVSLGSYAWGAFADRMPWPQVAVQGSEIRPASSRDGHRPLPAIRVRCCFELACLHNG